MEKFKYKPTPAEEASDYYFGVIGRLNRSERRTIKGRLIVAEAKAKALEIELAAMRRQAAKGE
ncbi:MAG: hypothetical protein WA154_10955 [Moraxellaceae bacterium]